MTQSCTHRPHCKRPGKIHHECIVDGCTRVVHACLIHDGAALRALQEHVRTAHPVEYDRVVQASKAPVQAGGGFSIEAPADAYLSPINPVKS